MTSDRLFNLRQVNTRMRDAHLAYAKQLKNLKDDPYMDPNRKRDRMVALAQNAQAQLLAIQTEAAENAKAIRASAAKRPEATEAAKLQVLRELDKNTKWQDLARFYVDQKDRAGLAALREQLKLEAATGRLGSERPDRALEHANGLLDAMELPILDERERRNWEEAREVNACYGAVETNAKLLSQHYTDAQVGQYMGHQQPVRELYNWIGVPDQDQRSNVGATSLKMPVEEATPGTDLLSRNVAARGGV